MDFTLSLCMDDLRTYPSGERILLDETQETLNKFKDERLICYDVTESDKVPFNDVEFDLRSSIADDVLTIVVKNLDVAKKYLCEIFLGVVGKKVTRPKLQSPYLIASK